MRKGLDILSMVQGGNYARAYQQAMKSNQVDLRLEAVETEVYAQDLRLSAQEQRRYWRAARIGQLQVQSANIADLSVTTAKIAALAVTTAKIALLAVTTATINDLAVTTAKVDDLAVTTAKIGALAVTDAKINDASITKLTAGNLSVTGTITTGKFVTGVSPNPRIEISSTEIVGYSDATTKQFYVSATDGKAYFGAGSAKLDSTGITATTLTVSGNIDNVGNLTSNGIVKFTNVTAVRIGSTVNPTVALDVTGAVLVSSTLGVTGLSSLNGGLAVTGDLTATGGIAASGVTTGSNLSATTLKLASTTTFQLVAATNDLEFQNVGSSTKPAILSSGGNFAILGTLLVPGLATFNTGILLSGTGDYIDWVAGTFRAISTITTGQADKWNLQAEWGGLTSVIEVNRYKGVGIGSGVAAPALAAVTMLATSGTAYPMARQVTDATGHLGANQGVWTTS